MNKQPTIKRIGLWIASTLLCAAFFTFMYLHWKLAFALMFGACAIGIISSDDDDFR